MEAALRPAADASTQLPREELVAHEPEASDTPLLDQLLHQGGAKQCVEQLGVRAACGQRLELIKGRSSVQCRLRFHSRGVRLGAQVGEQCVESGIDDAAEATA